MKHALKRIAAGIAAIAVMATGSSALPLSSFAAGTLIENGTFDSSIAGTDWGMYKESGGVASLGVEDGKLAFHITNRGTKNYAVQLYYDIIPLYQNGVYRLTYDISATTDRYVECMIQQNGGTYQAYVWKGINVTSVPQTITQEFTMEEATDIMAKMCFNCGLEEDDPADLPEHTIYLDNVSLELIDDSKVDYSAARPYQPDIITNQVGYQPDSKKIAVIRKTPAVDGTVQAHVVNAGTKQEVYSAPISNGITNSSADETDYIFDFSEVTTPGKYIVTCDGMDDSYAFEIGENVYSSLLDDSVKMLYLQRCGTEIKDADFAHPACHNSIATIYQTNQQIEVSGGWHDAGDYGRYVVAGAKAVADLMYAYMAAPEMYSDGLGIPESGNGKADILDEVKYELDWMLKMQAESGGVYHKVTCASFPGYVMPEDEKDPLIVMPISTTATADFCASMALAAEVYQDYDSAYAEKCKVAAEKAWAFLEQNPNIIAYANPNDIVTGEYGDKSDTDERYWAAAQMFRLTGDSKYQTAAQSFNEKSKSGLDWATVGDYGNIAILTMKDAENNPLYETAKSAVIKEAGTLSGVSGNSPYGVALSKYEWGSNMTIANAGIIMALAYQLTGEEPYLNGAQSQLNYLLGTNPIGTSFVTGYGTVSPEHPHHRPSMAKDKAMKGMLVGGVNQNLEDSAAKAYCKELAPALRYVDNSESYSTNEITIYWNSPLTYLLSVLDAEPAEVEPSENVTDPSEDVTEPSENVTETNGETTPTGDGKTVYGDVDENGKVQMIDMILLNKYLMIGEKVTPQGLINADVNLNGKPEADDGLNILRCVIGLVTLPIGDAQQPTENDPVEPTQPTEETLPETTENTPTEPTETQPSGKDESGMNTQADAVADFRKGATPLFIASDGWTNGDPFNCGWYAGNTSLDGGMLSLTIDKDATGQYAYSAAEYRTNDFYSYGYYETSMQAIKNPGVVSSFFTYTGPSDNNPWDEIDIEVLGKDTTKVQFNYYTNGVGNHEYMYDLGFDASEGFHRFGFDWQADHITWYVDGEPVYTATDNIPSTPGKIMMNVWPGTGVDEWLAPFDGKTPLTARYQWVTYDK